MINLILSLAWAGAAPLPAAPPAPAASSPTIVLEGARPRPNLLELHARFVEATDEPTRRSVLELLARTPPETNRDVESIFDLFMRFTEPPVRKAVMSSLRLMDPGSQRLETTFISYLELPENEAKIFGINGALRLRSRRALPLIEKLAQQRFSHKSPGETPVLADRNTWWAQFEALSALAQWQGAEVLPLLRRKADEAPAVARLLGLYLWPQALPDIVKWASASGPAAAEKAHEAFNADVPQADLRATRARLVGLMNDPRSKRELRHQAALKVGLCSTPEEVDALLAQEAAAANPETRLMLRAALFATRNPRTVAWLKKLAADDPEAKTRLGALIQLRLLLPAAEVRPLLEAAAARDADPDNRETTAEMLKAPPAAPPEP